MPRSRSPRLRATFSIAVAVLLLLSPMAASASSGQEDLEKAKEAWQEHQASHEAHASEDCQSPADGVTVCDEDEEPDPEEVAIEAEDDNLGSVEVTIVDRAWYGWTLRYAEVHVDPADDGPAGEDELHASVTCWDGEKFQPPGCNELYQDAWAGSDPWNPTLGAGAECGWLSLGDPSYCGTIRASGEANHEDRSGDATLTCGGHFTQCPQKASLLVHLVDGEEFQRLWINADANGVGLCLTGDHVNEGCHSV